ncbi:MAG: RNA methyltransferase, partial [Nevskiales bacterium]
MSLLSRIRVVLVGTQHPGNIGSAARAMKTMGLNNLVLVAPEIFPDPRADALAVGAVDLLEKARICADLDEALAGCTRVAATTARQRHISAQTYQPREWAQRVAESDMAGDIALMFGRERTGLTNEEIDRAQELVAIPTSADYTSLNIASAVQILCYELL